MSSPDDRYRPGAEQTSAGRGDFEPPRYGQRSEGWSPQPDNEPAEPATPWPVYAPGGGSGQADSPPAQWQGGSAAPPPSPFGSAIPVPTTEPPKRGWPVFTLVAGIVLSVLIAPAVFFAVMMSGFNFDSFIDGSVNAVNGGTVTVDETETIALLPANQDPMTTCDLTSGGTTHTIHQEVDTGLVVGRGISPGTYDVSCDIPEGAPLLVFTGDEIGDLFSKTLAGMLWGSVIGFAGVVTLIVGLVWLVRRNRARREYFRTSWYPPGRGM